MKIEVNIEKKYAYMIISVLLIITGVIFINAAFPFPGDVTTLPSHPLQMIAKCVNGNGVVCSPSENKISVDSNKNGKIDNADQADYAITAGSLTGVGLSCTKVKDTNWNGDGWVNVPCPAGYKVTGGGFFFDSNNNGPDLASKPYDSGEGWSCFQDEPGGGSIYDCYAVCCKIG